MKQYKQYIYMGLIIVNWCLLFCGIGFSMLSVTMISVVLHSITHLLMFIDGHYDKLQQKSNIQDKLLKDICSKLDIDYDSYYKIEEIVEDNNENIDNKEE